MHIAASIWIMAARSPLSNVLEGTEGGGENRCVLTVIVADTGVIATAIPATKAKACELIFRIMLCAPLGAPSTPEHPTQSSRTVAPAWLQRLAFDDVPAGNAWKAARAVA